MSTGKIRSVLANAKAELKKANREKSNERIAYWSAYIDGAQQQQLQDACADPVMRMAQATQSFLNATSNYAKDMNKLFDEINLIRDELFKSNEE